MTQIKDFDKLIESYRLPRINEIPDLELYMDQVIIYVKKYFTIFPYSTESNFITPAMINNYVKSGLIPAPVGKKYTKRHIAYIFAIFFLKQIFSLEEVKAFISLEILYYDEKVAYEKFCNILENELKSYSKKHSDNENNSTEDIGSLTLKHAALSIANKLYSQTLIKHQIIEQTKKYTSK